MSVYDKDICIIDLETTGTLERTKPTRITQVGIVKLDKDTLEIKDQFESYVNPYEPLTTFITNYTGITDQILKDAPAFPFVANCISRFFDSQNTIIAAWPLCFEQPILQWEYANAELKYPLDRRGIDIGTLARYYMRTNKIDLCSKSDSKDKTAYNLDNVSYTMNIKNDQRHSALADAINEAKVLQYILKDEGNV